MNCNEFMKRHFVLTKRIDNKLERLQRLTALTRKTVSSFRDCPASGRGNQQGREDLIAAMIDLSDEIQRDYINLCRTETEMSGVIDEVEDEWVKTVLEKRCLLHKKWDIVAYEMDCSTEKIFKKMPFILSELEKVLKLQ